MEDNNRNEGTHKINMLNRKLCTVQGVEDVISFDPHEILLDTEQGRLQIKGDNLHVSRLTKGEVDVDGRIDSLTYSNEGSVFAKGESIWGKLFK